MEAGGAIRGDDANAPAGKNTRHRIEARLHPRLHELWRLRSQWAPLLLQDECMGPAMGPRAVRSPLHP
eukprot:1266889-Prorocentrum_lima.AAC.1